MDEFGPSTCFQNDGINLGSLIGKAKLFGVYAGIMWMTFDRSIFAQLALCGRCLRQWQSRPLWRACGGGLGHEGRLPLRGRAAGLHGGAELSCGAEPFIFQRKGMGCVVCVVV